MDETVGNIFQSEFFATGSEVAISIPISLQITIDCTHQSKTTDIKLSVFIEKWLFNVLLNDV